MEDLLISLSDHQKHSQVKIDVSSYSINIDSSLILTSDGRGLLVPLGTPIPASRKLEHSNVGIEFVFTRAETKHWRKQENLEIEEDLKLAKYVTEFNLSSGPIDFVFDLDLLVPFVSFFIPLFIRNTSENLDTVTTTSKFPLLNIELSETCIFIPCKQSEESLVDDTFCLGISGLVLTPRPNNPLSRLVLIDSVYNLAMDAGLLNTAGSPLEDTQFELDIRGLSLTTFRWADVIPSRWILQDSGILTGENPALEWNRKSNFIDQKSKKGARPMLVSTDISAQCAPALVYKSKPITANSLEVSLNSDLTLYTALPQLKLTYYWINSLIFHFQKIFTELDCVSGGESSGRRRTYSETVRSKRRKIEELVQSYPVEFVLNGSGNIVGIFYDSFCKDDSYFIEPFLQLVFTQPSVTFELTEIEKIKLKLLCYDLSIKSSENQESLVSSKPFLPENSQFNIIWIETREFEPKPFVTFQITEETTKLEIQRPLRISLDLAKLKIAQKFMKKLSGEFKLSTKCENKPPKRNLEYSDSTLDLLKVIFHKTIG